MIPADAIEPGLLIHPRRSVLSLAGVPLGTIRVNDSAPARPYLQDFVVLVHGETTADMALQISLLEESDLEEFVEVDDQAMRNFSYAQAMATDLPAGQTRKDLILGYMRQGFKQDESTVWLKVMDVELGVIVAGALWFFHLGKARPEIHKSVPVKAKATEELVYATQKHQKGAHMSFMEASDEREKRFKAKYLGKQPYATLSILFTHPNHRHMGAGGMLVRWGCDIADKHDIAANLHASPEGLSLYLANQFEIVEQSELDLRPWGVNETVTRRGMIRPPKSTRK